MNGSAIVKKSLKSKIIKTYSNFLLKPVKLEKNKALFIITNQCYDNCLALIFYLSKSVESLKINVLVDEDVFPRYNKMLNDYKNITVISAGHFLRRYYELLTSHYVFYMHRRPFEGIKRKKGQLAINLWHGSGYKDVASNETKWIDKQDFDYVLVPGDAFIKPKAKFFSCSEESILPIGYPRYDLLRQISTKAFHFRNDTIGSTNNLIIWLPTFRQKENTAADSKESTIEYTFDIPLLKSQDELELLNAFCKENEISVIIKRHPFQKRYSCENYSYSNILFMSNDDLSEYGISLYELLTVTDALISDYSSVAIDYLLLNKPIAFCLDDFEQYKKTRGFVFDNPLRYMPGDHMYNLQDLIQFIADVSNKRDRYQEFRKEVMPLVHNISDNYCEEIWNKIMDLENRSIKG